jgi:hypothetical protein
MLETVSAENRQIALDILAHTKATNRHLELEELDNYRRLAGTAADNKRWAKKTEQRLAIECEEHQKTRALAEKTEELLSKERELHGESEDRAGKLDAELSDLRTSQGDSKGLMTII